MICRTKQVSFFVGFVSRHVIRGMCHCPACVWPLSGTSVDDFSFRRNTCCVGSGFPSRREQSAKGERWMRLVEPHASFIEQIPFHSHLQNMWYVD